MAEADEVSGDDAVDRLRPARRVGDVGVEPPVNIFSEEHPPPFGVGIGLEAAPLRPVALELDRRVRDRGEHRPPSDGSATGANVERSSGRSRSPPSSEAVAEPKAGRPAGCRSVGVKSHGIST
ncbi:hypothetical protein EBZ39_06675 [bacterium]|nr:hypothetical protein [bacterium]